MRMDAKFWISKNGQKLFGEGPCNLLKKVESLESLNKAAKELNISYSKAWLTINRAEKLLGYPLLQTEKGGVDGGGSYLTDEARNLIKIYEQSYEIAKKSIEDINREIFGV